MKSRGQDSESVRENYRPLLKKKTKTKKIQINEQTMFLYIYQQEDTDYLLSMLILPSLICRVNGIQ